MKSLKNKKGFTIVELVIVIAVIAILAAVLIPTFSGIVDKANKSAAEQGARNKYTEIYTKDIADGTLNGAEGDTSLETSGTDWNYEVSDDVAKVTYKSGSYSATFDGSKMEVSGPST